LSFDGREGVDVRGEQKSPPSIASNEGSISEPSDSQSEASGKRTPMLFIAGQLGCQGGKSLGVAISGCGEMWQAGGRVMPAPSPELNS